MALPPATLAEQLIGFASSPPAWDQVQTTALELANALRSKGPGISTNSLSHFLNTVPLTQYHTPDDVHTTIGQTDLPTALTNLLSAASESSGGDIPSDSAAPATFEVLRVAANVVMDHGMFISFQWNPSSSQTPSSDGNRQRLLDAGIINPLLSVLQGYAKDTDALRAIIHLRVAKTLIGVLLNLSLGYRK